MVLPHPGGNERGQREPKQQMQIRPQDAARNVRRRLQEVMMVVPVDADVNETQDVAEENRKEWLQGRKTGSLWRLHFQHHDSDDDGEYPITKSLHAVCTTVQGARRGRLLSSSDMISAGELPNPLGLFPLGLAPAQSPGANEA